MAYGHSMEHRNGGTVHLEPAIDEWYGQTFAALGDSIVWAGAPMLNRMRSRLGFLSYRNLGVSGRPMADGTASGVGTVTTALANNFTTDAMVYVAAGTNDFKLNVPLGAIGSLAQTSHSRSTFYGAYRTTIDHLLAQNPGVQIVLATPLQRNNGGYSTTTTNTAGHMLRDYRSAVFALGDMYSLPVVDLYALSGISEKTLDLYTSDGLHPNERGYVQMARVVVGQLRAGGTSSGVPALAGRLDALEYDTGWRALTPVGTHLTGDGQILFRRIGDAVYCRFVQVGFAGTVGNFAYLNDPGFIPVGFRPEYGGRPMAVMSNVNANPSYILGIAQGSRFRFQTSIPEGMYPGTGSQAVVGQMSWSTLEARPSLATLPGDPA